ncbi:MAG: Rieske 2Fe-2S domain-containing protein [Gemmatimonadales bacterium]
MAEPVWHDLGPIDTLAAKPLQQIVIGRTRIALSHHRGEFGAISGACNHVGGPLGDGQLDGDYVVCPWHHWKYHRQTGNGEPGYEAEAVPRFELKQEDGHLWVNLEAVTKRRCFPTNRTRWPVRSSGNPALGWSASRPPRWTPPTRASRPPNTCSRPP